MQGRKQHSEKLFLSFQLSDRVPSDNFYRRLKDLLDLRWLYKATAKYYGTEGQQSIDPVVFFRFMLIGYLENIISDRRIINTVSMRLDLLFFIGYDIDESLPWHSTLSRTRQLYGEEVFKELFKIVLKQCIEKGMVGGCRQAVDSVLVKANASMESVIEKEVLKDAEIYADELREEDENNDSAKPAPNKKRKLSNSDHYSTTDADARISTKPNKPTQLNYLGQLSVDTSAHVITNIEAHYADRRDSECLAEVVENTIDNLASSGVLVEEILCDGNYNSGEALQYLEENKITGYIASCGQYKAERKGFIYHIEGDHYECSQGNKLTYKNTYKDRDGYYKKEYRSDRSQCTTCPLKKQCLGKVSKEKKLSDTVHKPLYDRMHARMQTSRGKYMRKVRQSTVEPVIGSLTSFFGMRKVNTIGIQQANKCMLISAIAYNVKKMMKWTSKKINTLSMEIKKINNQELSMQFCPWYVLKFVH